MIVPFWKEKRLCGGRPSFGRWDEDNTRFNYRHEGKTYKVSRLVCEAFNGPAPADQNICMHLDENSRNNQPSNLHWGTQKENMNAPGFLAYCCGRTGDNSPRIKGLKKKQDAFAYS